ncbi:uncharacterized protein B0H64DRAFT_434422 [Chaetomium fimeti]|uniref:Uncharacterized protein n=1 Tax=Chaetomium fimeti TaxID=1854472 RepID=A0AAE0HB42_9PEZI|nr:hypothetical protein B0H64DRAFT_434422 [Chaetomium fimeti]
MIDPLVTGAEPTRDSGMLSQDPITADCFLPPRTSCPKAWQRVAVAPVPGLRRQLKIWKRVGGQVAQPDQGPYVRAMSELELQGDGPRKQARRARHMQAWGDARWDSRVEEGRDGKQDLVEARAMVSAAEQEAATPTSVDNTKPSTFSPERLKWVPRKRHNSRWPIEPKKEPTRMMADLQPLIEFDVPASPEPSEAKLRMDEKQMGRRSTRRLSRRISLIPGEGSPRKLPMITLSPANSSTPALSPVKRPPVSLSPTKVADSPHRSFSVNATPMKVVLESPKINPPERSPAKLAGSPAAPVQDVASTPAASAADLPSSEDSPASPVPLLFDQPIPDAQVEPQYEACRRRSLQSARRSDRGSSGASRLLALKKSGRSSPNRRHSFTSLEDLPADARGDSKSRRNTMDVFCVGPEEVRGAAGGDEVVEIDMKTSLDIFGQPNKTADSATGEQRSPEETQPLESESRSTPPADTVPAHGNDNPSTPSSVSGSSPDNAFGVTEGTGVETEPEHTTPRQVATSLMGNQADTAHDSVLEPTPHTSEESLTFEEETEPYGMFEPQDPEGLSTIYEESSYIEGASLKEVDVEHTVQARTPDASGQLCIDDEQPSDAELIKEQLTDSEPSIFTEGLNEPPASEEGTHPRSISPEPSTAMVEASVNALEASVDERSAAESVSEPHVSASHVANTAACMASPDSPLLERGAPAAETSHEILDVEKTKVESPSSVPKCDTPQRASDIAQVASSPSPIHMEQFSTPEPKVGTAATQEESSGFTPINGRQPSPPNAPSCRLRDDDEAEADQESDELDADEVLEEELGVDEGDDAAMAMDMDEDMTVEPPRPECDTLQLHARHDDSETEMLRNFVTRVTADKNAKAAAAAAALVKKIARRSGSLGSITSSTGSPMAKPAPETPASRTPLGERSPNSRSPAKKRKADSLDDDLTKDGPAEDPSDQPSEAPRLKRRRTRAAADPILSNPLPTTTTTATPSPEPDNNSNDDDTTTTNTTGPRRSTRARSTRVALRPSAPSANAIAFSMIPVRLPGMGAMDDAAAMDAHLASMARQRSEEKGLAAATRANTRKNKGAALPPPVLLARQAEDPAGWRMRELKGGWEAKERRAAGEVGEEGSEGVGVELGEGGKEKGGKGKAVRWAEELVRFQDNEPSVFRGMARELLADVMVDDDGVDEIAEAEPPVPAEPVVEKTARVAARKAGTAAATPAAPAAPAPAPVSTRRTRSSRLPPPTPVKKMRGAEKTGGEKAAPAEKPAAEKPAVEKPAPEKTSTAAPSLRTRARSLPRRTAKAASTAPAPPAVEPQPIAATASKTGMATRRTRVTKLGMSGNGTPAPKRRGKAAA